MTTKRTLIATACLASLSSVLHGQTSDKTTSFQYFRTSDAVAGKMAVRLDGIGQTITGKPFSGIEERQTVQVLGDGTRINKRETDHYFRDNQGRTRIERDNGNTIVISDPVDGFTAEMNATNKSAHKTIVKMRTVVGSPIGSIGTLDKLSAEVIATSLGITTVTSADATVSFAHQPSGATEDLGTQIIGGVPAQGTRSTITIPTGEIGNDREIKVVSERWFSTDLQMLIKSSNTDPRFGETTYQLTSVIQGAQDPSLFQIPADFNLNGPK